VRETSEAPSDSKASTRSSSAPTLVAQLGGLKPATAATSAGRGVRAAATGQRQLAAPGERLLPVPSALRHPV
jgi:hypothetical protein